jgi:hypothetical protein
VTQALESSALAEAYMAPCLAILLLEELSANSSTAERLLKNAEPWKTSHKVDTRFKNAPSELDYLVPIFETEHNQMVTMLTTGGLTYT